MLAGNAVIPTIDAACRLAAAQAVPLLISGGVGHSTGYLYEAVRRDPRYRRLPVDGRPEAHVLADIAHDYWHIPIRGWWWRTSQPTAVRTPVLPGPRWRAGARPSSRDRHSGPDYAAANHGYLRPRLAGATTPPQWLSFPGCSPVLEQTDGQLGFAGGGAGSGRSPATRRCCWASCRACRIPLKGTVRGERLHQPCHLPAEILDARRQLREDAQLAGALQARTLG